MKYLAYPMCAWAIWAIFYSIVHFIILRKWVFDGYQCFYNYVQTKIPITKKWVFLCGKHMSPLMFMIGHCFYVLTLSLFTLALYSNFYVNLVIVLLVNISGYWWGSARYVKFYQFR